MMITTKTTKSWKTVETFSTYEEADQKRKSLLAIHAEVKVKCGGKSKSLYRVKVWDPLIVKEKIKLKKNFKKSKNNRKQQKSVNKKVHAPSN